MNFTRIDLEHWDRKPYFEHYLQQARCTFSMTATVDITLLKNELGQRKQKLYPALIYMLATIVNRHREFRTCFDPNGQLGYWDAMSPSFTTFHADDRSFSSIWTAYSPSFSQFYHDFIIDLEQYGGIKQLLAKPDEPPNTFPISCIPWVNFTSFNLNIYSDGSYLTPIFTYGKYASQGGRIQLPLSLLLHHAVCDGYHAGLLYEEMQTLADECAEWL
ncbi:type A chloramphenicol O-acetyltransferase [Paenibacillus sp. GCM10027626]|uniref:type A chloramphenicol O-acetyltransferase n=1 Tax=Paenibacillus sp. GCM10027626 TaxID=3273411 RepID=UPI003633D204